jgi:eukaryotic-like serine/threonine-protein kinase
VRRRCGVESVVPASYRCCATCFATFRTEFARCPIDGGEIVDFASDPFVGATVDHYTIDRCVGEGGMGRVYLAHHVRLEHRRFALKVLFGDLAASLSTRLRFSHEAEAASRLHHENVIEVFDFGRTSGGLLYLIMDFVEGVPLSTMIAREGPLAVDHVVALARGMSAGLAHAHAAGLVHRDFKPDNVLVARVDGREVPRIVDFGLALELDASNARLTTTGLALGTPIYAAPEQVQGHKVDQRADLFALGVTLYEMVSGRAPFDGDLMSVMIANATQTPPPIAERAPGVVVPPRLEALIRRLMARDPSARPGSAGEVTDALDQLEAPESSAPAPVLRRRGPKIAALITTLVVTIGGVAIVMRGPPSRAPRATIELSPPASAPGEAPPDLDADRTPPALSPPPPPLVGMALPRPAAPRARRDRARDPAADTPATEAPEVTIAPPVEVQPTAPILEVRPTAPLPELPRQPAPPPIVTRARVDVRAMLVQGPLAVSTIARALDKIRAPLAACYGPAARAAGGSPRASVAIRVEIDESGRARGPRATSAGLPQLAPCVSRSLQRIRTDVAPDVGTAIVTFTIDYRPEPS